MCSASHIACSRQRLGINGGMLPAPLQILGVSLEESALPWLEMVCLATSILALLTPRPSPDAVLMFPSYHHRSLPYGTPHHRPLPPAARQTIHSSHHALAILRRCSDLVRLQCRPLISPSSVRSGISVNKYMDFFLPRAHYLHDPEHFFPLWHCSYSTIIFISVIGIASTRRSLICK